MKISAEHRTKQLLAAWLIFSVLGAILSTVKFFLLVGLIAAVVMLVVTLITKR